ncbi:MAG: PHP domain-containing protein [Ruminococcaceae bacterium]|nr:PHP domain-containing protein [Oscillospiraceae bacterium]
MIYLISPKKKQYKANLHCHSTFSDGKRTPRELKDMYKKKGYSILSITDHECPKSHSYLDDEEFITVTGYEAYIRKDKNAAYDLYEKETHLNLFARDSKDETIICYNAPYCKYLSEERKESLIKKGSQVTREYSVSYINQFIKEAKENGYIVAYNHPCWSMEDEKSIMQYEGFFSMEMCNYSAYKSNAVEYNANLYNKLLYNGKKVFCHSADDNHNGYPDDHPKCDSYGGFTMIMPKEFTYDYIFEAMEKGEMYSSMGPTFKEVSMDGRKIHIECSPVDNIIVYTGSKSPKKVYAKDGETVTSADFEIDERAIFVRVSIGDKFGKRADTRGYFRDELEF